MIVISALLTAAFAFRLRRVWKAVTAGTLITWLVAAAALLVWYRYLGCDGYRNPDVHPSR